MLFIYIKKKYNNKKSKINIHLLTHIQKKFNKICKGRCEFIKLSQCEYTILLHFLNAFVLVTYEGKKIALQNSESSPREMYFTQFQPVNHCLQPSYQ